MKPPLVIFDGSNFYHSAKKINPSIHLTNFEYRNFVESITNSKNNQIEYYVGEIKANHRNQKAILLQSQQLRLFSTLEKQGIRIIKGYMLKSGGVYHEKGVDVQIAIRIMKGAFLNDYDTCYLISSDSDLLPAIEEAKQLRKEIIYVAFAGKISNALRANCSKTIIIENIQS